MNNKISYLDAIKQVKEKLEAWNNKNEDWVFVIMLEETIETNDYWVFFYNSSKFLETGNFSYSLIGNAPFIVDKYKGEIYVTGTARSIEYYMEEFEKEVLPKIKGNEI
jgi:hypothetical protein